MSEIFNADPMEEVRTAENTLSEKMSAANQRENLTRSKLESLQSEYATLLLDLAMNRSTDTARKYELRIEIRGLETDVADSQILQVGFKREKAKIVAVENKARAVIRNRRAYLEARGRITELGPGLSPVQDLKMLAKKLGCQADCETFLASLAAEGAAQAQEKAV